MFANPTRIQFLPRAPAGAALAGGAPAIGANAGAAARRGVMVRRPTGRPVLACRWIAVAGGRLECRWIIEFGDDPSIEEPKGSWRGRRAGLSVHDQRSPHRHAVPALDELET